MSYGFSFLEILVSEITMIQSCIVFAICIGALGFYRKKLSAIMETLISNVYAAYQFCDDSAAAAQLHELWNGLIFEGDSFTGKEDVLVERLQNIAEMIKPN